MSAFLRMRQPDHPQQLGGAAALVDAVLAVAFGLFVFTSVPGPPVGVIPRAPVLAAILLAPALVGAIGALTGTRVVLLAAAVVCFVKAGIAFSGVTLAFLLPAVLYLRAAASSVEDRRRSSMPRGRWLLIVALSAPVVVVVMLTAGVAALPLVILGALAPGLVRRGRPWGRPITGVSLVLGLALVGVLLGTFNGIAGWTETVCWTARQTPAGTLYERVPETDTFTFGPNDVGGGCDSGVPTPDGVLGVAALVLLALVVAMLAVRTSGPRPESHA